MRDNTKAKKEVIIFSVGGSLIVPHGIDTRFLKDFRKLILKHVHDKYFILIAGGGRTARQYQDAAKAMHKLTDEDADWLGIHSTRLNAHLVRTIFKEYSDPRIIFDPSKKLLIKKPVYVAAGWKPGCSTDYDAVLLAENVGAKAIINLSNTNYVYDKDPKKHSDAKVIREISWNDFRKLVGNKWKPGLNMPFDPIASKKAQESGMKVIIVNGKNMKNLDNLLKGKSFAGTTIQ